VTSATRGHVAGLPWARGGADLSRALGLQGPRAAVLVFVAIGMVHAGEEGEEDVLEQALACAPPHADTHAMVPCVRAVRAWLSGDVPRAIEEFRVGLVEAGHAEVSPWWGMWVLMRYAADPADREGVDFVRASGVLTHPGNPAALDLADALHAARSGREDEARALLARGEERLAAFPFWLRQLRCVLAPAAAQAGLGDPVTWLRDALAAFEEDGEVRLAALARDLLRRSGAPVPRRRTDGDGVPARWRALGVTAREAQVLERVRQGRSNAEIAAELVVSVRTVETHVSSLLAKTGASSRAGLAAV
jgi:DNA-binding CsgD family transcriptional regulator